MADTARLIGRFSGILRTLVLFIHFGEKNANCYTRLGRSADVHGISNLGRMSNALSALRRTSFGSVALCEDDSMKDFDREAALLASITHNNIVKFYGACIDETPWKMIFEFMEVIKYQFHHIHFFYYLLTY